MLFIKKKALQGSNTDITYFYNEMKLFFFTGNIFNHKQF